MIKPASSYNYQSSNRLDLQGWNGDAPILSNTISNTRPSVIFDVGVWKGQSTINMAKKCIDLNIDCRVYAIDTFLGSTEHIVNDFPNYLLPKSYGYPSLYYTFLNNVICSGVADIVYPIPNTSDNAFHILKHFKINADLIHIDAAHEYDLVLRDMENYWQLLNPGGTMICDDYFNQWPGVVNAVNDFINKYQLVMSVEDSKAVIKKH